MKKHIAGRTGLSRIRLLVAFRHQNPLARLVSTVLAFAIAMLLVIAPSAAFGDDGSTTPTDPTTTDTSAPADTTGTDTSTDTSSTPDSSPASDNATSPATSSSPKTTLSKLSTTKTVSPLAATPPNTPDWDWQGSAATHDDEAKDSTAYGQGSSEDKNPLTWSKSTSDTPKADLLKYYFNVDNTDDIIVSFGFTRASITGDTAFAVEMNRLENTSDAPPRPNRSVGDLLLKFHVDSGSSPLTFAHAFLWKPTSAFAAHNADFPQFGGNACTQMYSSGFGWCEIPKDGFQGRTADGGFTAEGKVDLTDLFGGVGCSGTFHSVNLRSESSAENWSNSLQDYLPLDGASVPNTCSTLVINKYRLGASGHTYTSADLLSGAHFDVYSGSSATGTPVVSNVYDGKAGVDKDSVAGQITLEDLESGTYTVKETSGVTGYFPPNGQVCADPNSTSLCTVRTKPVGKSDTVTFNFYNQKIWQPLTVTKDGAGSYDATYHWSIEKGVAASKDAATFGDSLTKNVPDDGAGDTSASFGYQVKVTQGARNTSHIAVTGNLYVDNPNSEPVDVTLSDDLAGATCSFADDTVTVPANAVDKAYAYSCTYPNDTDPATFDRTNVGSVAWSASTYPQDNGSGAPLAGGTNGNYTARSDETTIGYTETATNKSVTIHDDKHAFVAGDLAGDPSAGSIVDSNGAPAASGDWKLTWTDNGGPYTATYDRSISSSAGTCRSETNTATLSSGGSADATARVCVGANLDVSKVSKESLTRTYLWTIEKSNTDGDNPLFVDPSTGDVTTHWDVTVAANGKQDTALQMTGTITVTNPNDWQGIELTGLTDRYSWTGGGQDCTIDGWATMTAADKTVPMAAGGKDGTKTFDYTCVLANGTPLDGTNRATTTWDGTAAHTPAGTDFFDLAIHSGDWKLDQENNKTVTVDDGVVGGDPAVQIAGPFTWSPDFTTTFEYTVDLGAPTGECKTWTNSATLQSGGSQLGSPAQDDVTVCNPSGLTAVKNATPEFVRTYNWNVIKQVRVAAQGDEPAGAWENDTAQWVGDAYSHGFEYRIGISRDGSADSAFKMVGTITVTNTNKTDDLDPITATVSEPATIGGVDATCAVYLPGEMSPLSTSSYEITLASGEHIDLGYTCDLAGAPAANTTNTATISWGTGDSTTATSDPVNYTVPTTKVNDSVSVIDDMATATTDDDESVATATWDGAATSVFTDPYPATYTATETGCSAANTWTNTATLFGDSKTSALDSDTATAAICPNAGAWTVSKTVADNEGEYGPGGPAAAGDTLHYRLTATKTGGVDPTNVVATDDLSDIAAYITGDPSFSNPDASYDSTTHVLTWDVGTLSGTETLDFSVTIKSDAYGVDLPNLVVAPTSANCAGDDIATAADECKTDNKTPHYTLAKSSEADHDPVMPEYLGNEGTIITYTLTVHNNSDAPITDQTMSDSDRTVTDDLSGVIPTHATLLGAPTGDGSSSVSGTTLTWHLPRLEPNDGLEGGADEATISYQVQVNADQWDVELRNIATPGNGGDCVTENGCETTNTTPKYALVQALKVDADTGAPLAGAEFTLTDGKSLNETATSGADGLAKFTTKLQTGTFTVTETKAPPGYALPAEADRSQPVNVTDLDLDYGTEPVENAAPVEVTFQDPPLGDLAISKAHQELSGGTWVPGDGTVNFNDQVKYVITVTATGTKVFQAVRVTDYVPGYGPNADKSQLGGFKGVIDTSSITCSANLEPCNGTYANGVVTWTLGDLKDKSGTVEFVVRMPNLPVISPLAAPGVSFAGLMWNQAYMSWTQADDTPETPAHHVASNEVTDRANATLPPRVIPPKPPQVSPPAVLPNTGGPDSWLLGAGLLLLLGGGTLIAADRRRRHRS